MTTLQEAITAEFDRPHGGARDAESRMPAWVKNEKLWKKAKAAAAEQGKGDDYAYITGVYKQMGGKVGKAGLPARILAKSGSGGANLEKAAKLPSRPIRTTIHMYETLGTAGRAQVDAFLKKYTGMSTKGLVGKGRWLIKAKRGERKAGAKYLARFQVGTTKTGAPKYKYVYSYAQLRAHLKGEKMTEGSVVHHEEGHVKIHKKDGEYVHVTHHDKEGRAVKKVKVKAKDLVEGIKARAKKGTVEPEVKGVEEEFEEKTTRLRAEIEEAKQYGTAAQIQRLVDEFSAYAMGMTAFFPELEVPAELGPEEAAHTGMQKMGDIAWGTEGTRAPLKKNVWAPPDFKADQLHDDVLPEFPKDKVPDKDVLVFEGGGSAYRHQMEASARINKAWEDRDGFVLMDVAGLGKTVEALMAMKQRGGKRNLVVVPTSGKEGLKQQWGEDGKLLGVDVQRELSDGDGTFIVAYDELYNAKVKLDAFTADPGFTPEQLDELAAVRGDDRREVRAEMIAKMFGMDYADAYGVAMGLQDYPELKPEMKGFDTITFDESHSMSNPGSLRSQAAVQLQLQEMGPDGGGSKMLYMSATPFTTLRDTHYLRGLGWFRTGDEFAKWAEDAGASLARKTEPEGDIPFRVKNPDSPIPTAIVSAKMHVEGAGMKRSPRYDVGDAKLKPKFSKHAIKRPEHQKMFETAAEIGKIAQEAGLPAFTIGGMMTLWKKQAWELVKADDAIAHAKEALKDGRQVAIFTEYTQHEHGSLKGLSGMLRKRAEEFGDPNMTKAADRIDKLIGGMFTENIMTRMAEELGEHVSGSKENWHDHVAQVHGQARDAKGGLIGRGRDDATAADLAAYQGSKGTPPTKRVVVASMAKGGTGMSYHDKHGHAPRTQINMSMPWHAVGFDQVAGRSHRLGSKSDTEMTWMHGDDASELNVASTVANKLKSMKTLVEGDPGAAVTGTMMASFESGHNMTAEEQAMVMHAIETGNVPKGSHAETLIAEAEATKAFFKQAVDDLRAGGNPLQELGGMVRGDAVKAFKDDEEHRVAAGQLTAQYGTRITMDPDRPMRFRVQPGNLPAGAVKALSDMKGVKRYSDGSFSVGETSVFKNLAERINPNTHAYEPKKKLGKKDKLFSNVYGKVFAPSDWSSESLAAHHEKWTKDAPEGGHHTHTAKVKQEYAKEHAALVKEQKKTKKEREGQESAAKKRLGKLYAKVRDAGEDKKKAKRGRPKKVKKSRTTARMPKYVLAKAKELPVGTIRTHGGVKKQKQGTGDWKAVSGGKRAARRSLTGQTGPAKQPEAPAPQEKKAAEPAAATKPPAAKPAPTTSPGIPPELEGQKVSYAELEKHGGVKHVLGHLKLSKMPPMGGKNPIDPATIEVDLTGDVHSHALMTWRDGKGRLQSAYSQEFVQRNANQKWARVRKFRHKAPMIGDGAQRIMTSEDRRPEERDAGAIVSIIQKTGLRPGSTASAKHEHYGVKTLLTDHVSVDGDTVSFDFVGKSGKQNTASITDPELAAYLGEKKEAAGPGQPIFSSTQTALNTVLEDSGGAGAKLKDFRTVQAAEVAAVALATRTSPPPPLPGDPKQAKRAVATAVREASAEVADHLNNTPAIALSSYIPPTVIDSWVEAMGGDPTALRKAEEPPEEPMADEEGGEEPERVSAEDILAGADERVPYPDVDGPAEPNEEDEEDEPEDLEAYPLEDAGEDGTPEAEEAEKSQVFSGSRWLIKAKNARWRLKSAQPVYMSGDGLIWKADGTPSGPGWQPVPGGKHGGFRRKAGNRWEYWYPSVHHAARAQKFHAAKGEKMRKKLGKVLKKRGASQEKIEKFLNAYDHHSTTAHHANSQSQAADTTPEDKLHGILQDRHGLTEAQAKEVANKLGGLIKQTQSGKKAPDEGEKRPESQPKQPPGGDKGPQSDAEREAEEKLGQMDPAEADKHRKTMGRKQAEIAEAERYGSEKQKQRLQQEYERLLRNPGAAGSPIPQKVPKKPAAVPKKVPKKPAVGAGVARSLLGGRKAPDPASITSEQHKLMAHVKQEQDKHKIPTKDVISLLSNLRKKGPVDAAGVSEAFAGYRKRSNPGDFPT